MRVTIYLQRRCLLTHNSEALYIISLPIVIVMGLALNLCTCIVTVIHIPVHSGMVAVKLFIIMFCFLVRCRMCCVFNSCQLHSSSVGSLRAAQLWQPGQKGTLI